MGHMLSVRQILIYEYKNASHMTIENDMDYKNCTSTKKMCSELHHDL